MVIIALGSVFLDETVTFGEAVTVITLNVVLLDDNALEGDEDFKAQQSTSSGSQDQMLDWGQMLLSL